MHAEENQFRQLIENTRQLVIPLFQRFYVWKQKAWEILWNDLTDLVADEQANHAHFLGSLVLIPVENQSLTFPKFIVIDGQQRMATLLVLLAAVRDRARATEEPTKLAEEIEQKTLFNTFQSGDGYYKLLLSEHDQTAFQHILTGKPNPPDHVLVDCHGYFQDRLRHESAPALRPLFEAIASRLSLVVINLDTHENPYLVFESLNFKGHKLTEADLIRNYLFMRIPQKDQKSVYQTYWKPMEEALGDDLTEFVRHYLARSGAAVKQSEVYITLKRRLSGSDVRAAIQELASFADCYARLLEPAREPSKPLRAALERLSRLEITTVYPFLLNIYRDYSQGHLTDAQCAEIVARLENYLLRRFVCGNPSSELNKLFAPLYNQIQQQEGSDFVQKFSLLLQRKGYPTDETFGKHLLEQRLYGRGDREKKTRYLLETLERHYKHKEPVDFAPLSIEHIMPQTLNDWWREHLGEGWGEIHEKWLHTIGNLTLTGYNGELYNSPFPIKRQAFLNSHLVLNSYFQTADSWRPEDIRERAEQLVEHALQCWPSFGDPGFKPNDGAGFVGTKPEQLTVLGQTYPVKSWREVLQVTLERLLAQNPTQFAALPHDFPQYIGTSPQGFRTPKNLCDGYYFETNLGALIIRRLCQRIVERLGYPPTAWEVKAAAKDA